MRSSDCRTSLSSSPTDRKPGDERTCVTCSETKPPEGFYLGRRSVCKACIIRRSVAWSQANPEKRRASQTRYEANKGPRKRERDAVRSRTNYLRRRYGISAEQFESMLSEQDGLCAICGASDRTWHMDHDHACCPGQNSCGKCLRKILCGPCNQALGLFQDNPALLHRAMMYLEGYVQQPD